MPKSELVATEYYNDFLAPQDIHSCLMVRLAVRGTQTATINITRGRRRGQFDAADLELARSLHPHLLRAFDLGQRLAADRALGDGPAAVFDASPHGLFLTDGEGRVRRMNAAGEAMAAARRGLRLSGGRLAAIDPAAARMLQGLVARATASNPSERNGGSTSLPTADGMVPLSALVAPVRTDGVALLDTPAMAIVCITDLEAGVRLPEQRLREIFGLTQAEARLALALFEGETVREAAESLGGQPFHGPEPAGAGVQEDRRQPPGLADQADDARGRPGSWLNRRRDRKCPGRGVTSQAGAISLASDWMLAPLCRAQKAAAPDFHSLASPRDLANF